MKKPLPFKLTEQMIRIWKECVIDYLTKIYGQSIGELADALMTPDVLNPMFRYKGEIVLRPGQKVMKAYYLKKGAAKLCAYDENGDPTIYYIWDSDSIIVLYKEFIEKLNSEEFYIELIEDSELVSISSMSMDDIYEKHTVAYKLTTKILTLKTEQRNLQLDILHLSDKLRRYCVLKQKFSWLFAAGKCRLSNKDIYSFINISESTLKDAKKICPDE